MMLFLSIAKLRVACGQILEKKAQGEPVVITKYGHPLVVIRGVAGKSVEEIVESIKQIESREARRISP